MYYHRTYAKKLDAEGNPMLDEQGDFIMENIFEKEILPEEMPQIQKEQTLKEQLTKLTPEELEEVKTILSTTK